MHPISKSTERRILDSISQDEHDTDVTESEALLTVTTRNLILVFCIPPFIWGCRASNNFILIYRNNFLAQLWNESRNCFELLGNQIAVLDTCPQHGSTDFLHKVSFFWICGPTLLSSSSNISGCIRRKLKNECTSSILSSAISRSYWPYCSLLSAESKLCTHMNLNCFRLFLCLRTTRNAACASIMTYCLWINKTCWHSLVLSILQIDWK